MSLYCKVSHMGPLPPAAKAPEENARVTLAVFSLWGRLHGGFFRPFSLRKMSCSSLEAVALLSGSGSKQHIMKVFARSDMVSGTLGWVLNMPT